MVGGARQLSQGFPLQRSQPPATKLKLTFGIDSSRRMNKLIHKHSVIVCAEEGSDEFPQPEISELAQELEQFKNKVDPERNTKHIAHLNLIWSVSEVSSK